MEFKKEINIGIKNKELPICDIDKGRFYNLNSNINIDTNYQKSNVDFNYQQSKKIPIDNRFSKRTKSSIDQQNPVLMKVLSDDSYKPKKNSVAKVKMIKEMYKKNPINNPMSVEENNYNDTNCVKALRVNGYMNSSGMMSNLQQIHFDTSSELNSNRKKRENHPVESILLKQSLAINDHKKSFKANINHGFGGKTGFYF